MTCFRKVHALNGGRGHDDRTHPTRVCAFLFYRQLSQQTLRGALICASALSSRSPVRGLLYFRAGSKTVAD